MKKAYKVFLIIFFILLFINSAYALHDYPYFRFEKIFEQHGLVKLIIEVETGTIEHANQAAVEFYGYNREELLGMKIYDINILTPEETEREWKAAAAEDRNYFIFEHVKTSCSQFTIFNSKRRFCS